MGICLKPINLIKEKDKRLSVLVGSFGKVGCKLNKGSFSIVPQCQ